MKKVINGTRVNALTKQTLDFSFRSIFSSDDYSRVNEVISLSPRRRDIVGSNRRKENYMVSVIQVRGIRIKCNQEELLANFSRNTIIILGVVDHKITFEDPVEYYEKEDVTLTANSPIRNATMQQSAMETQMLQC